MHLGLKLWYRVVAIKIIIVVVVVVAAHFYHILTHCTSHCYYVTQSVLFYTRCFTH
jgi:hypothetical protein